MAPVPSPLSPFGDPSWSADLRAAVAQEIARPRTVWTARALLAPYQGRRLTLRLDDGQHAAARRFALYDDLLSRPDWGLVLVLRGLSPTPTRGGDAARRHRTAVPVTLLSDLPDPFRFLQEDRSRWPVPPVFAPCAACGAQHSTGRFCVRCGALVRQGAGSRWWGEGFVAVQRALRALARPDAAPGLVPGPVRGCRCGAVRWVRDPVCTKCGDGRRGSRP